MNINLNIARGIAAILVVFFHYKHLFQLSFPNFYNIINYGKLGVPLFFVISGYVITASAESTIKKKGSSNQFLKRRFIRIYPAFWLSILVVITCPFLIEAISALKSGQFQLPTPEPSYFELTAINWLQMITLTKAFTPQTINIYENFENVNVVYWTLAIEFQFYLCVYFSLLFRNYFRRILALITILSLIIIPLKLNITHGLFLPYWPMFALGIIMYYIIKAGYTLEKIAPKKNLIISTLATSALSIAVTILAYHKTLDTYLISLFANQYIGFALISFILLWIATPLDQIFENAKENGNYISKLIIKPVNFLGTISYSTYLIHIPILPLATFLIYRFTSSDQIIYPILITTMTLLASTAFYYLCEKPFMSKNTVTPLITSNKFDYDDKPQPKITQEA